MIYQRMKLDKRVYTIDSGPGGVRDARFGAPDLLGKYFQVIQIIIMLNKNGEEF